MQTDMRTQTASAAASSPRERLRATRRHLALWTFQAWLAMFFIAAGYAKVTEPLDNLAIMLGWPDLVPLWLTRGLGWVEVAAGLALLAPLASWRFGRGPMLAAAALISALGLIMLGVHLSRMDWGFAALNAVLAGLAIAVVKGRGPCSEAG